MSYSISLKTVQGVSTSKRLLIGAAIGASAYVISYATIFLLRHVVFLLSPQLLSETTAIMLPRALNFIVLLVLLIVVQRKTGENYAMFGTVLGWIGILLLFNLIVLNIIVA